ncbi:MAG TPA: NYN domain-containing protein [Bryobacteraceae bacterium]|jgi:hypothetical protein|nr:NYN domain-containing protein [Bryobacteraceae bacterium]
MKQVRIYIDGYNFYYAIKRTYHLERLKEGKESRIGLGWCDFRRLGEQMIDNADEKIDAIKYFTARVEKEHNQQAGERSRQGVWLDAIASITGLRTIMGRLQTRWPSREDAVSSRLAFNNPRQLKPYRNEKCTDVNIAVEMLMDALDPRGMPHKFILITADTDLAPAVFAVQKGLVDRGLADSGKTVDVWLTPDGSDREWKKYFIEADHACPAPPRIKTITEPMLATSLLSYSKPRPPGCPDDWRLPGAYLEENVPRSLRPDLAQQ